MLPANINQEFYYKKDIESILSQAFLSVDSYQCVYQGISVGKEELNIFGKRIQIRDYENIYLIGIGKAVIPMAEAIMDKVDANINAGLLIAKHVQKKAERRLPRRIKVYQGGHPIPDQNSLQSALNLKRFLEKIGNKDLVINLVSGGGSALMALPHEGISLIDIQRTTDLLLKCGANIYEINTIRKHIDQVKGGGIVRMIFPAKLLTLILSDVVGDDISTIASGPTVVDQTTFGDAVKIINKYNIRQYIPSSVNSRLEKGAVGEVRESLKTADGLMTNVSNTIIGSLNTALFSAEKSAKALGYKTFILSSKIEGESQKTGKWLGTLLNVICSNRGEHTEPICIIAGGESTVTIKGGGKGGRNQELALAAAIEIEGIKNCCFISIATDGEDGPTDAAGAFVTGKTVAIAKRKGLSPKLYLENNDSYSFFKELGNLIKTGPTGTNVNDIILMFCL